MIAQLAATLYARQKGTFTLKQIAEEADITPAEIFNYFPNKRAILRFYYTAVVLRYRMMTKEIEEFDTYLIGEKLSNFMYASMDMLQENAAFVEQSFDSIILRSYTTTDFQQEVERLLRDFIEKDVRISNSSTVLVNEYCYSFLYRQYVQTIDFWLQDKSEGKEVTMVLIDKSTGFLEEALYTSILDKGFDLLKFALSADVLAYKFPFIKTISSKFEIR